MMVGTSLATHVAAAADAAAVATPDGRADEADRPLAFDIPAQPLASALDAYSVAAHRDVLYNGQLAVGRRSAAVRGRFAPEAALRLLLEGTGLAPRYVAADAFVLVESELPPAPANAAAADVVYRYYGRIQASLKQAFCASRRLMPDTHHVAVGFRIGPSGAVFKAELLGSTGDRALDDEIGGTVRSLVIGAPPPPGFAQPVILVLEPPSQNAMRDCNEIGRTSAGAAP